jgi:hypothetical protein
MTFLIFWSTISTTLIEKSMSFSLSGFGNMLVKFDQSKYIRITTVSMPLSTTKMNISNSSRINYIMNNTINSNYSIDVEIGIIRIDSIYLITIFFILIGLLWLSLTTKLFERLKKVSLHEWKIKDENIYF